MKLYSRNIVIKVKCSKTTFRGQMFSQAVKRLVTRPAPHIRVPEFNSQLCPYPQLPALAHLEGSSEGSPTWAPAAHMGLLSPGFSSSLPTAIAGI